MEGLFDRDKWQEIFGTIRKNKLRTFLTALGVFWGIFMLVFLLGMGKGLENGVWRDFGSRPTNIVYMWAESTTLPYDGLPSGRNIRLTLEDINHLKDEVEEVNIIAPRMQVGTQPVSYQDIQEDYNVRGEMMDMPAVEGFIIHEGRYINQGDLDGYRKVAVIGTKIKEVLFDKDEDALGKHIRVRGIDFKVVGVFGPQQVKEWTRSDMESVVIPLTTMSKAFGTDERVHYFAAQSKPGANIANMFDRMKTILKQRHRVSPEDTEGIDGFNLQKEADQINGLFIGIQFFLWFVGIGTLIAGVVGVSNIMLIVVKERTKEIGLRKALGASPRSIISMILTESVFITALSGYLGLAIGTVIIWGINSAIMASGMETENFYNPEVNLGVGLFAMAMLVIAGAIAGLVPALQASRVNPVEALKDE